MIFIFIMITSLSYNLLCIYHKVMPLITFPTIVGWWLVSLCFLIWNLNHLWYISLIVCLDHWLVGHGNSSGERVHVTTFQTYVRDIVQHIEMLKQSHTDIPFFLLGHSMVRCGRAYIMSLHLLFYVSRVVQLPHWLPYKSQSYSVALCLVHLAYSTQWVPLRCVHVWEFLCVQVSCMPPSVD